MRIPQNRHLTFCTNIYAGENWKTTFSELQKYIPGIKKELAPNEWFGLGLRLSYTASEELGLGEKLSDFKKWLDDNQVYVFTMNGFPYGNFHQIPVKDSVHAPDWTTEERLEYTKKLARQLAVLLPEGASGGISTSPISYKHWHKTEEKQHKILQKGAENLLKLAIFLENLEKETGHHIHIDIEPEPDGLLENSDEMIALYTEFLIPQAEEYFNEKTGKKGQNPTILVKNYLQVCYDICHFSLAFEEPEITFAKFARNNISIGKIQISSALKILFDPENKDLLWDSLARFNEATYLHQVTEKIDGKVITYSDLPEILSEKRDFKELRAHFHVPVFLEEFQGLFSTQDYILKTLDYLQKHPVTQHLEVETYTWEVLPESLKIDLSSSIIRELQWVLERVKTNI
ncbi:metabolite traffic protein EboE [Flavimarina sp. Hel_I_48]|uniref:metabolite traffic protein EboE n=1 Tax=Flavimarina sp. Hel_I_48 TaxID=1392488 RepID=UPI0004DF5BFB|nr:metabolite traffic protein EboE [Flavimarina sp. Hel_I_48]